MVSVARAVLPNRFEAEAC